VFIDAVNRDNPAPDLFRIEATNPCVTRDCVVHTNLGTFTVADLVGKYFETPDGVSVPKGFFRTKTVTILARVTSALGYSILCTPEHRLMTADGWKEAKSLTPGDKLLIKAGSCGNAADCAKASDPVQDEFYNSVAQLMCGGSDSADYEEKLGMSPWDLATALNGVTLHSAVRLVRALWVMAGRPDTYLALHTPVVPQLREMLHLALLKLGIVCDMQEDSVTKSVLYRPIHNSLYLLNIVLAEGSWQDAVRDLLKWLTIRDLHDKVASVEMVTDCGSVDVYDATCDNSAGKPVLWTGAFWSHNCSEVPLSPYEKYFYFNNTNHFSHIQKNGKSCCLGSINLRSHVDSEGRVNWHALEETVHLGVRFLSDVIMANKYVPLVPQLEKAAKRTMRIGLGIMGVADMLFRMKLRYGSPASLSVVSQMMEFIRYHSMLASMHLAAEKGAFPAFRYTTYCSGAWRVPSKLDFFDKFGFTVPDVDIGRPTAINWEWLKDAITRVGLRNITTTAVAPTGTLSLVGGVSGFGCEPVFALAHRRRVLGKDGAARYEDMLVPELMSALNSHPDLLSDPERKQRIIDDIMRTGTCAGVQGVPSDIAEVFVCATDISVREHIYMQATLQSFVDGAISKTINMPQGSTVQDVSDAMVAVWQSGCKGVCVYVAGSRQLEVLTAGVSKIALK
jgi:ribonucleotide reductase alpha subunit